MRDDRRDDTAGKKQRVWDEFDPEEEVDLDGDGPGAEPEPDEPHQDDGTGPATPPEVPGGEAVTPASGGDITDLQPLYQSRSREFYLMWFVAVLAYGVGDTLTTGAVLVNPSIGESNPLVQVILQQFGIVGLIAIKLGVFAVLLLISIKGALDEDKLSYYAPPFLAIFLGTVLTLWNFVTILGV